MNRLMVQTVREQEMALMGDDKSVGSDTESPVKKLHGTNTWRWYWEHEVKGSPMLGAFNIICCVVGVGLLGIFTIAPANPHPSP